MTCAPVDIFAIHFEISSEKNEPPMPNTAAKISMPVRLMPTPCWYRNCSSPSTRNVTLASSNDREVGGQKQQNAHGSNLTP